MSTIKTNRLEAVTNTGLPTNLLPVTASAWVNFNGTGVPTIRGSHNVGSITDNGTGDYTPTLIQNLSDSDYAAAASAGNNGSAASDTFAKTLDFTNSSFRVVVTNANSDQIDANNVSVIVLGGQ